MSMIAPSFRRARLATLVAALPLALAACSEAPQGVPAEEDKTASVTPVAGDWAIDPRASHLAYVTIKAGEIAESNRFDRLSGMIGADGAARIEIDLASVNTGIEIRDERMRNILFEVTDFPTALVTAQLDPQTFASLEVGKTMVRPINAQLSIKGMDANVEARIQIARVSEDRVIATTTAPVIVTTDMFGLTDELGDLRVLAQLPSISPAVPVTFTLTFNRS
jgi:polyisoprenoid-binding protein YceI